MTEDDVEASRAAREALAREAVEAEMRRRGVTSYRKLWSLAVQAGVDIGSQQPISQWLQGERGVTAKVQEAIAAAFGWPIDWPEHPPEPVIEIPPERADEIARILGFVEQLYDINVGLQKDMRELRREVDALKDERRHMPPPGGSPRRQRPARPATPDACS